MFADVVIGAPHDNYGRGAVYVYLGSSEGLVDHFAQRLTPADLGFHGNALVRNFGRSMTGRTDVDSNAYAGRACVQVLLQVDQSVSR